MFVITRKPHEEIILRYHGIEARIVVLSIESTRCKIGIDAPRSMRVLRKEVLDREERKK